jgi:hypothetical protein
MNVMKTNNYLQQHIKTILMHKVKHNHKTHKITQKIDKQLSFKKMFMQPAASKGHSTIP